MARQLMRPALRPTVIALTYGVLWLALDRLAYHYSWHATPWYLGTALSFYLLFAFGLRYAPAIVIIEVLRGFISARHHLTFEWLFVLGLVTMVIIVPAVWLLQRMNVRLFSTFTDVVRYLAIGCIAMPLARALAGVAVLCLTGDTQWSHYWATAYSFGLGDLAGMITLVPFLAVFVSPHFAPQIAVRDERATRQMGLAEIVLVWAMLVGGVIAGYYVVSSQNSSQVFYFVFIPLTWLALRGGLRWAIAGMLASDLCVVLLHQWFNTPPAATAAYQSYLTGSSFTTLMLGVVVNQRSREEREAVEQARRDPVTGLPNRQAFEEWLARLAGGAAPITICCIEFPAIRLADEWLEPDGFRTLQRESAARLAACAPQALILAQLATDRIAAVLPGNDRAEAARVADRILRRFEQPLNVGETELFIVPQIGIANATSETSSPADLVHEATQAVRIARSCGTELAFYDAQGAGEAVLSLSAQLHRALQRMEFVLYYQPIWARNASGSGMQTFSELAGAEAHLRWNHPERGTLEPQHFIDLLESLPLSERVGNWILEEACRQLVEFRSVLPSCTMWINVFSRQALSSALSTAVARVVAQYGFRPGAVVLELNEKLAASESQNLGAFAAKLRDAGAHIAIDDVGKTNSPFARLREIPCDALKLDVKNADLIAGLAGFAQDIGTVAIAEGVERLDQIDALARTGCAMVQGNLLGPPLPADIFMELARQRASGIDTFMGAAPD